MTKQPSYHALPGQRWGTGSASVLRFLLRDMAQKPAATPLPPASPTARRRLVSN